MSNPQDLLKQLSKSVGNIIAIEPIDNKIINKENDDKVKDDNKSTNSNEEKK